MSFQALHPGYCGCGCGEAFDRGTRIVKVDDFYWWIEEHAQRESREEAKKPCDKCHLIHAGECF